MSRSFDFDPAERFTAGAIGEPGARTFFIQGRSTDEFCTLLAEKEQVFLLARELRRVLAMLPEEEPGEEVTAYDLELIEPLEPDWRVGGISIEFDPERDRIIVLLRELDLEAMREAAEARMLAEAEPELAVLGIEPEEEGEEDILGDDDDDDEDDEQFIGDAVARFVLTRAQVAAMAEHAMEVVASGRPRCEICGEPLDPGVAHACASMNGHKRR